MLYHRSSVASLCLAFIACLAWLWPLHVVTAQPVGPIYTIQIQSSLTLAHATYLRRAVTVAEAAQAEALVIVLSSSGGVLRELRPLATELAQASIPVVVFVAPSGTASGAPGAFLLSAAHIAALAPDTSFGSAVPLVAINSSLSPGSQALIRDGVAAELQGWNLARGRNSAWVDQALQTGIIVSNQQAMVTTPPMVNLVASDLSELLVLLDDRQITLGTQTIQLNTRGRTPESIPPTLVELLWMTLAEPNVAFALLVLGALAIYLELAAPGSSFFAGVGVVLLIASVVGLVALPVQAWAVLVIILALVLVGLEFVVTSHGGLTVTGLALLAIGGLNLVDPNQAPGATVAPWAVAVLVAALAGVFMLGITLALRNRRRPVTTGSESLVGRVAEVRTRIDPQGMVFCDGALWQAVAEDGPIDAGEWVRIVEVHRLRLIVKRLEQQQQ